MSVMTRRQFIATATLSAGFAAAVKPISASVITTSASGLIAGPVRIPVKDGEIPAYRAQPDKGENFPIILVVHEIFGVHEHIQDVVRRFAKLGYLAIAPELFLRQGDVSHLDSIEQIRPIVAKVPDAQVLSDLDSTVAWAVKSSLGNSRRLGITGFCWGGRIVWLYCAHNPNVKAGVAWYGKLVGETSALMPKYPIDIAQTLTVPVLGLYGGKDNSISQDTVEEMRKRLKQGTTPSKIVVYPEASHAFFADYRPSYQPEAAQDGWKKLQDWFKTYEL